MNLHKFVTAQNLVIATLGKLVIIRKFVILMSQHRNNEIVRDYDAAKIPEL